MRALFKAEPLPPPKKEPTAATAGSLSTIFTDLLLFCLHRLEGNVLRGLGRTPIIWPVSCCGKNPFGTTM